MEKEESVIALKVEEVEVKGTVVVVVMWKMGKKEEGSQRGGGGDHMSQGVVGVDGGGVEGGIYSPAEAHNLRPGRHFAFISIFHFPHPPPLCSPLLLSLL